MEITALFLSLLLSLANPFIPESWKIWEIYLVSYRLDLSHGVNADEHGLEKKTKICINLVNPVRNAFQTSPCSITYVL